MTSPGWKKVLDEVFRLEMAVSFGKFLSGYMAGRTERIRLRRRARRRTGFPLKGEKAGSSCKEFLRGKERASAARGAWCAGQIPLLQGRRNVVQYGPQLPPPRRKWGGPRAPAMTDRWKDFLPAWQEHGKPWRRLKEMEHQRRNVKKRPTPTEKRPCIPEPHLPSEAAKKVRRAFFSLRGEQVFLVASGSLAEGVLIHAEQPDGKCIVARKQREGAAAFQKGFAPFLQTDFLQKNGHSPDKAPIGKTGRRMAGKAVAIG